MVRRIVLAVLLVHVLAGRARADSGDTVALLPLDADQRLEIYSHVVASELAKQLGAGGIDVVVVGPNAAVPERAQLVVDGTITAGKGGAIVLAVRIRERATGATLDKLDASAPNIDRAAADLAAHVLPSVKARLAALHAVQTTRVEPKPAGTPPAVAQPKTLAITVTPDPRRTTLLEHALPDVLVAWAGRHRWQGAVASQAGDAHITLTVQSYDVTPGAVPLATAHVRVQIDHAFDRVVITDTVVGDRNLSQAELAARTARAVLDIVEPHMRRAAAAWR